MGKTKPAARADTIVQGIIDDLSKEFGDRTTISIMGEGLFAAEPREWFSSGLTLLDAVVNRVRPVAGCIPVGRMTEIFGDVATAKSMLLGTAMGHAQREKNAICALIDTEQAWSVQFIRDVCHADPNNVYYLDPTTLEDCWGATTQFIDQVRARNQDRPIFIGIDSLAGLPSDDEDAVGFDEHAAMASGARANRKAMRKLRKKIALERVALVMTNQETAKIGVTFGEKTTTSGGGGPKFFSSLRLKTDQIQKRKENNELVGVVYRVYVYKTRFTTMGGKVDFFVNHKLGGIDDVDSVVTYLLGKHQLGTKKGWVVYGEKQYRPKEFIEVVRGDANLWEQMRALAIQTMDRTVDVDEDEPGEVVEGI